MRRQTARAALLGAGIPPAETGNRRYYQRQDVLTIRQIRSLLYEQGFTIGGARQQLSGDANAEQSTRYHQMIKQMIVELEDVLDVLNADRINSVRHP